jgi:alkylation response protein AidB-like acyl-CoA dehydrogenase
VASVFLSDERRQLQVALRARLETAWYQTESLPDREERTRRTFVDLAALDLTDIMVPTELGGSGGGLQDVVVVCGEAGRVLLEGPIGSTAAAAIVLRHCSPTEGLTGLVRQLSSGERIVTISDGVSVRRAEADGGPVLEGSARFVLDADVADRLLVVAARPGAVPLVASVDAKRPGVLVSPLAGIGPHQPCHVRFDGVGLADREQLGPLIDPPLFFADIESAVAVSAAAEASGAAERVMEIAVDYAQQRTQFGQPIGSFQATQFRCVDVLIDVEAMRCATARAAESFDRRLPERHRLALGVASYAAEGFIRVTAGAHRVLGAIGFSAEGPLSEYTRAAEAARSSGGPRQYRRRLAEGLAGSAEHLAVSADGRLRATDSDIQQIPMEKGVIGDNCQSLS